MKIHHIRNATMLLTLGERRFLVDPMLAKPGDIPGLKMFGGGRKPNPLVPIPQGSMELFEQATDVLITHEHPDHIDIPAIKWIKKRGLPVWASSLDAPNLRKKGLDAREFQDGSLGMRIEVIPAKHGKGIFGWLLGPVSGFYLSHPGEPSVYITGDSILTKTITEAIERLQPDLIIAPAGSANFGIGSDILFSQDELLTLAKMAPGKILFNHLESLDHCPTTRTGLRQMMIDEGISEKVLIPNDGEAVEIEQTTAITHKQPKTYKSLKPGFQKWVTAKLAGT